jgi:DNA-binding response OmpR family regulator
MNIGVDNASIIVLEHEVDHAIELQSVLLQSGFQHISTFHYCETAEHWLETHSPDVAIVDPRLRDGLCRGVVSVLTHRKIPFIVYSSDNIDHVHWLKGGTRLPRPCGPRTLLSAIHVALMNSDAYTPSTFISLPTCSSRPDHLRS